MYAVISKRIGTIIYGAAVSSIMVIVLSLFVSPVSAWPNETQWNPVLNQSDGIMTDPIDDAAGGPGQATVEIVGNDSYPAAYMFNNGTHLFFRMRLGANPQGNKDYLAAGRWVVVIDTDGNLNDYEYAIVAQVVSKVNYVIIAQNTIKGGLGDPSDVWETELSSYIGQVNVSAAPSNLLGSPDYFIDWFVPYNDFLNYTNTTNESVMKLILGTGGGTNEKIDKDIGGTSLVPGVGAYLNNTVSAPVSPTGTVLTNGSVEFVADINGSGNVTSINVTDTIYVKVNDSDRNTDSLSNQTLNVTLFTSNGDNETITLNETGNDTGIYTGSILTENATVGIGDGTLQVVDNGSCSFNVTYNDTTADGTYVLRIDNATVNDTTLPTISYNTPPTEVNNTVLSYNSITVNVTAYDLNLENITINLYNKSDGNLLNSQVSSGILPSTSTFQIIFSGLSNGDYLFNATANDTSGNSNTTLTRNVTILVTGGVDLKLTSQNITFVYDTGETAEVTEAGEARENINLTINATVYNQGSAGSSTFYVLFYDGNSEFHNVSMNSIAGSSSANATAYWTTLAGTHNITIKVDPSADTSDTDRSNNNASKLINVSAWQKYYGNATGNYMLANYSATSMRNWTWDNETNIGYLYVVNTSASINWSALHPLGYDSDNSANITGQDFQNADTNLGMIVGTGNATGFQNNNITDLFTNTSGSNYGNVAINTTSFVIFGNTINNVPVVNTTDMTNRNAVGSANFITGVLWDDTKDSNGYYDTTENEDLIFITKIRQTASGLKGSSHNYEIAVPHTLNLITEGDVDMYMELI